MTTLTQAVGDALDKARDGDERESIDNRERGCGHLKPRSCYLRSDVAALSSVEGDIPRFVELDDPVEYREHTGRGAVIPGWKAFPGESFAKHYVADGRTTTPENDIVDHADERSWRFPFDGDHYADITSARAHDVLMSVGASNWETPEDYVDECRDRGLNLKIPVSDSSPPPVVEPLRTRVWVIHPNGAGEKRPAIIGYAYVTRNVFTTGTEASQEDADVPGWADDYATTRDDVDLVDRGEPIAEDDPRHDPTQTAIADHVDGPPEDFEEAERRGMYQSGPNPTDDDADTVVASDKDGRDVESADPTTTVDGVTIAFGFEDATPARRAASFFAAIDDGPLTYNGLKQVAAERDADVGANPSKDDLVGALSQPPTYALAPDFWVPEPADDGGDE